jgi:hypothetical protein
MADQKTRLLIIELINKQLEPHGVTYTDVKDQPDWYLKYSTTPEKEAEFIEYCTQRIQSELDLSLTRAKDEAQWFILQWGLTTKQTETV